MSLSKKPRVTLRARDAADAATLRAAAAYLAARHGDPSLPPLVVPALSTSVSIVGTPAAQPPHAAAAPEAQAAPVPPATPARGDAPPPLFLQIARDRPGTSTKGTS